MSEVNKVETTLIDCMNEGRKALVVYITGGLGDDWIQTLHSVVEAGADVVEIGIPFSDPVMDGPVIQKANDSSMKSGSTPVSIVNDVRDESLSAPLAVMTYTTLFIEWVTKGLHLILLLRVFLGAYFQIYLSKNWINGQKLLRNPTLRRFY